jgi:formate dehydrogenase assembly factor FdhD
MTRDERATEAPPLAAVTASVLRLPAGISEPDRLAVEEPHAAGLLRDHVLCVSGRPSFELVQKAAVVDCPVLVAVGAPSGLAVALADDRGITDCGFERGGNANVYTEPWRLET